MHWFIIFVVFPNFVKYLNYDELWLDLKTMLLKAQREKLFTILWMLWNLNKQKKWSTIQRIAVGLNISKKEATIAFLLYYDWIHTICNPNVNRFFIVTKSVFSYIKITSNHHQDTNIVLFDSFLNICKKNIEIFVQSQNLWNNKLK